MSQHSDDSSVQRSPSGRPSLRQVAEAAGVAVSSVSRVLNGHPDVSEEMRDQVMQAVEELGYEQNLVWESLRLGRTMTIGMIVRDITSRLWADIALAAETNLGANGYSMLLANSKGEVDFDARQIRLLNQRRVDGLIVSPNDCQDGPTLAALERSPVPIVLVDREIAIAADTGAVLIDHAAGVRDATKHLLELGHERIGFIAPPPRLRPAIEASRALQEATYGTRTDVLVKPGPFTAEHGFEATKQLLEGATPPTAVISGSGQAFPGVLRAIREAGLRVPTDLSLLAIDDIPLLAELEPAIAVISRQPSVVGAGAAELLLDMLNGAPGRTTVVPAVYTPAESVAAPRTAPV